MYVEPEPPIAYGRSISAPPRGMLYTCPPLYLSHPPTMIPAISRFLFE